MSKYALISGGVVSTVVEQATPPTLPGQWIDITGQHVGPGFTYSGGVFAAPAPPVYLRISVEAFWDRFTTAEGVDFEVACQHNGAATLANQKDAAKLRIFRRTAGENGFVMLGKAKVQTFLTSLESAQNGITILAAGRAAAIYSAAVTDDEAFTK